MMELEFEEFASLQLDKPLPDLRVCDIYHCFQLSIFDYMHKFVFTKDKCNIGKTFLQILICINKCMIQTLHFIGFISISLFI